MYWGKQLPKIVFIQVKAYNISINWIFIKRLMQIIKAFIDCFLIWVKECANSLFNQKKSTFYQIVLRKPYDIIKLTSLLILIVDFTNIFFNENCIFE